MNKKIKQFSKKKQKQNKKSQCYIQILKRNLILIITKNQKNESIGFTIKYNLKEIYKTNLIITQIDLIS